MENKVAAFAATPDPTFGQKPAPQKPAPSESAAPKAQGSDLADMRLVIEEDKASGSYVYKTVNRLTGEVLMQFPRDDVLKMRERVDYQAGAVIRTKA